MPPQDLQKMNKSRAPIIDSVMRNPKLSRIIHEAAASPLGSTKREKAKSIISILNKTDPSKKYGGQGGPGDWDLSGMSVAPLDVGSLGGSSGYSNPFTGGSSSPSYGGNVSPWSSANPGAHLWDSPGSVTVFPSAPDFKNTKMQGFGDLLNPKGPDALTGALSSKYSSQYGQESMFPNLFKNSKNYGIGSDFSLTGNTPDKKWGSIKSNLSTGSLYIPPETDQVDSGLMQNGKPLMTSVAKPKPVISSLAPSGTVPTPGHPVYGPVVDSKKTPGNSDPNGYNEEPLTHQFSGHGIINNFDITSYATDPNHENAVLGIYNSIGMVDNANTAQAVISSLSPKSPVTGQMVIDAANKYKVDPSLMIALMQQDSSLGTKGLGVSSNNPGNVGNDGSKKRTYNTIQGGVNAIADWLSKHIATGDSTTPGATGTSTTGDSSTGSTSASKADGSVDYVAAYNLAQKYIDQNVGPELYAKAIMGDNSLNDQEKALAMTLYKQYDLDNLLNKKTELEAMNPTIKQDMTDYIKARDTYVGSLDNMLDSVNSTMSTTDISNPGTNKMYQDYRNYLLTLKGRQNQRYGQYLNNSITQYNTDLTNVQNQYTNAKSAYDTALKSGDENLKANYKETHDILTDMYKTLEAAPGKRADLIKKTIENNKLSLENVNGLAGYKYDTGTLEAGVLDQIVDKNTGELLPSVNLPGLMQSLSVDHNNNPGDVLSAYTAGALSSLKSLASSKNPSLMTKALEYTAQIDEAINPKTSQINPVALQQLSARIADMKQSIMKTIVGSVGSPQWGNTPGGQQPTGLSGYLVDNYSSINKIVKRLSGEKVNWHDWGAHPIPTRDELITEFSNIDPGIVGAIYDLDKMHKAQFGEDHTIAKLIEASSIANTTTGDSNFLKLTPAQKVAEFLAQRITAPNALSSV